MSSLKNDVIKMINMSAADNVLVFIRDSIKECHDLKSTEKDELYELIRIKREELQAELEKKKQEYKNKHS